MTRLGVAGGMGPASTAYFYELLTLLTDARTDQEHLEIIIYSKPQIPDRTAYIMGLSGESPLPAMIEAAGELEAFGVGYIAVPCVTAHHFRDELKRAMRTPIVDMLEATANCLRMDGISRVGLLATDGTLASGVLPNLLRSQGVDVLFPAENEQAAIMRAIYGCKAGSPVDRSGIALTAERMQAEGAEAVLLACTELSVMNRELRLPCAADMLEILARRCVELCGENQ